MANFMPGEWDFPLDQQAVFVGAERKSKLADALRQQAVAPQGQMVGGVFVAPSITQYLASGLKQYQAGKLDREATAEQQKAYQDRANVIKAASQRYADALKPQQVQGGETKLPFEASQMDRFGSPMEGQVQATQPKMVTRNPTPQDMFNAQFEYAQAIGNPQLLQNAANQRLQYDVNQQTRQDERAFKSQEAQLQREQNMQNLMLQIQARQQQGQETRDLQRQLAEMQIQSRQDIAAMTQANRPPQTPVAVMGEDGKAMYVPSGQAYGMRPYTAKQEAADALKGQQQEQARISAQQVLDQAANLYLHPGRQAGTGASSFVSKIPGTDARGFQANLDTFKAQTFVPMVSALKGMGALSDAEGRKLSESVGALDPSMPEDEFARSLKNITKTLYDKAKANGLNVQMPDFAASQSSVKKRYNPQTGRIE